MLRQQIDQNFADKADRQRIMTGALDQVKFAIRETSGDALSQPVSKRSVLRPMPKRNRHANFVEGKSPGRRINLRVGHHAGGGRSPGLPGALETNIEGAGFAQNVRIAGLKKLEQERA